MKNRVKALSISKLQKALNRSEENLVTVHTVTGADIAAW